MTIFKKVKITRVRWFWSRAVINRLKRNDVFVVVEAVDENKQTGIVRGYLSKSK